MAPITLAMLQVMLQQVLDEQKRHDLKFHDVKCRLNSVDRAMTTLKRNGA